MSTFFCNNKTTNFSLLWQAPNCTATCVNASSAFNIETNVKFQEFFEKHLSSLPDVSTLWNASFATVNDTSVSDTGHETFEGQPSDDVDPLTVAEKLPEFKIPVITLKVSTVAIFVGHC